MCVHPSSHVFLRKMTRRHACTGRHCQPTHVGVPALLRACVRVNACVCAQMCVRVCVCPRAESPHGHAIRPHPQCPVLSDLHDTLLKKELQFRMLDTISIPFNQ